MPWKNKIRQLIGTKLKDSPFQKGSIWKENGAMDSSKGIILHVIKHRMCCGYFYFNILTTFVLYLFVLFHWNICYHISYNREKYNL